MKNFTLPFLALVAGCLFASFAVGQCVDGVCPMQPRPSAILLPPSFPPVDPVPVPPIESNDIRLELNPLAGGDVGVDVSKTPIVEASSDSDRLAIVTRATVRVTVGGACGSGTVVGRDRDGNALILTNAHVAGTQRGRGSKIQRWNLDGSSEQSTAKIIASGYSRGLSVDFALLRAAPGFAKDVVPVPLADRYPDGKHATNYGCPRCEWPSMQTVQFTDRDGQILRWKPEAIGGRSGSSIVDYSGSNGAPVVIGLLTWGGGGEGLGQSSPFVIDALHGRMPKSFETLPMGVTEVSCQDPENLVDLVTENDDAESGLLRRNPDSEQRPAPIKNLLKRETPILDKVLQILIAVVVLAAIVGAVLFFRK